jgi:ferredoxin--NADP+ reductase
MFEIKNKQVLSAGIKRIDVFAPTIARKAQAGQFVGVCPKEGDERVPLVIVDNDPNKQTIALIFQELGPTTKRLGEFPINEPLFSVIGPLGVPSKIEKKGTAICIATGVGAVQILPVIRALRKVGNKIIGVIGAKTRRSILLESQMRIACNKLFITTNDGTYERKGLATDMLKNLLEKEKIDFVYAVGSTDMMEAVCQITQAKNIETRVQLNPMMVDCMGMCGSCRVKVGDEIKLACMDGPEFDGHKIDYDYLHVRMNAYEESVWRPLASIPRPKRNESKTLPKFLSGILKK